MSRPHRSGPIAAALVAISLSAAAALAQSPPSALHTGRLEAGDAQLETGEWYDEYVLEGGIGEEIIAVLSSLEFDPYLILIPPSGEQLDNDDFSGSPDVALIEIPIEEAGRHVLRVTSYEPGETGEYALMAGTREADGDDMGHEGYDDYEPETFDVKGPIALGREIAGTIGEDDPTRTDGSHYEAYSFQGEAGMEVVVDLVSTDFDAFLALVKPSGDLEQNDDVAEGDTNSRIAATLDETGEWIVVANTLQAGETGSYRLTITRP